MFALMVEVEVRRDLLPAFERAVVVNAQESVRRDRGCLRFDVLRVADDETRWVFYEVYDDEASWQQHRQSEHFLSYKAVADRALVSRRATVLTPIASASAS